ncbi:DinB family protein [Lederbergia citri]|uniref:DinB family protein n=1 Tax=Lederbergia citri TaxID=2833580 RepID=A0A942YH19_9BACI|nr:DinB family protein [Lederbergia citri]MBS4196803.1 DinB family protein [Lederbergia citri]
MYTTIEDFLVDWGHESGSTLKLFNVLTDESLAQEVSPQNRTLGRIAWHIVTTLDEMMGRTGLKFDGAPHDSKVPHSASEIAEAYCSSSDAMVTAIREQWTDETLKEEKDMYGEMWSISTTFKVLITHQAHHRGQLTVLMRQAGLIVPGVYGPAREEWAAFGGQAPEV